MFCGHIFLEICKCFNISWMNELHKVITTETCTLWSANTIKWHTCKTGTCKNLRDKDKLHIQNNVGNGPSRFFLLIYQICVANWCQVCVNISKRAQDLNSQFLRFDGRIQEMKTRLQSQLQSIRSSIDHLTRITQQQASTISSLASKLNNFHSGIHMHDFITLIKTWL